MKIRLLRQEQEKSDSIEGKYLGQREFANFVDAAGATCQSSHGRRHVSALTPVDTKTFNPLNSQYLILDNQINKKLMMIKKKKFEIFFFFHVPVNRVVNEFFRRLFE